MFSLPDLIDIMRPKFKAAKENAAANSTDTVKRGVGVAIGIYGCGLDGPDSAESWAQYNDCLLYTARCVEETASPAKR